MYFLYNNFWKVDSNLYTQKLAIFAILYIITAISYIESLNLYIISMLFFNNNFLLKKIYKIYN